MTKPRKPRGSDEPFNLNTFLPYKSTVLASIISDTFAKQYASRFGISVYEWRCIAHLAREPKLSVRDIAERAGIDRASVTRAVAVLEARGYVTKIANAEDKRLVDIGLTRSGDKLFREIVPVAMTFETFLVARCKEAGIDNPHHLIDVLIAAAKDFKELT